MSTIKSWFSVVANIIDVLSPLGSESDRDLARPGMVLVTFGDRSRLVFEAEVGSAVASLRRRAVEDLGTEAANALPEPQLAQRGLRLPDGRLARANIDWAVRDVLFVLRLDLVHAGDQVSVEHGPGAVHPTKASRQGPLPFEYGLALDDQERKRYLAALAAVDRLPAAPRLSDDLVADVLMALRRSIGRKAGKHRMQPREARGGLRTRAAAYILDNPEATNREIADKVGVDRTTIGRWDEAKRARATSVRDPGHGIVNQGQIDAVADGMPALPRIEEDS